jgi:hypothetical protein
VFSWAAKVDGEADGLTRERLGKGGTGAERPAAIPAGAEAPALANKLERGDWR